MFTKKKKIDLISETQSESSLRKKKKPPSQHFTHLHRYRVYSLWHWRDHLVTIFALWCVLEKCSPDQNPFTRSESDPAQFTHDGSRGVNICYSFYQGLVALAPPCSSLLYNQRQSEDSHELNEQHCQDCTITACPVKCYLHMTARTLEASAYERQLGVLFDGRYGFISQWHIKLMCQEKLVVCMTGETERKREGEKLLFTSTIHCSSPPRFEFRDPKLSRCSWR